MSVVCVWGGSRGKSRHREWHQWWAQHCEHSPVFRQVFFALSVCPWQTLLKANDAIMVQSQFMELLKCWHMSSPPHFQNSLVPQLWKLADSQRWSSTPWQKLYTCSHLVLHTLPQVTGCLLKHEQRGITAQDGANFSVCLWAWTKKIILERGWWDGSGGKALPVNPFHLCKRQAPHCVSPAPAVNSKIETHGFWGPAGWVNLI